ncbi:RNA-binding protein [Aerococcus urinaehominis]|uniref:RNA-binding protein n=1 Tax=Aerococcus urinaehominis TaxID=128944 RepID=A0A0X8FL56_9LACT|nr:S4 domain-containing protein YaaA [Aerococcus urinaehominis]AMB99332.1 RNA-binding protein [Aerococcus urinaehominis]SDM20774.1 S4 domain protein YaaA [Aerococcus urinaehominis]
MKEIITIDSDYITLSQLLKGAGVIGTGGQAKWYLSEYTVLVDGETENRRGRKLYPGSSIIIPEVGEFIISSVTNEETADD